MALKIETGKDNTILRQVAEKVTRAELPRYKKLGEQMVKYIKDPEHGGVGLAAPQIGVSKRLIVVSLLNSYEDEYYSTIYMINPEIVETSKECDSDTEGCLSVPGEMGEVTRPISIKVEYLDGKGQLHRLALTGLAARIVQHEIDHVNGVLFTDYLENQPVQLQQKVWLL